MTVAYQLSALNQTKMKLRFQYIYIYIYTYYSKALTLEQLLKILLNLCKLTQYHVIYERRASALKHVLISNYTYM